MYLYTSDLYQSKKPELYLHESARKAQAKMSSRWTRILIFHALPKKQTKRCNANTRITFHKTPTPTQKAHNNQTKTNRKQKGKQV